MREIKIGTAKEWVEDYKKNISPHIKNNADEKDRTVCFWYADGSDCYAAKDTVIAIKRSAKANKKDIEYVARSFGLSMSQYQEIKASV